MISDGSKRLQITLTSEVAAQLEAIAKAKGVSKSAIVSIALTEYLDKQEKEQ